MDKKEFNTLIVDDDEIARDVISSLLKNEGYNVFSAIDGLDAIGILKERRIDFVITDLMMPGADGIEVLRHALKTNPHISVVILTAYGNIDNALAAMKEGAYDYLKKPFKAQELIFIAEKALRRAELINENKELIRHLREICRDLEIINKIAEKDVPGIKDRWLKRINELKAINVLTRQESEILTERLENKDNKNKRNNIEFNKYF